MNEDERRNHQHDEDGGSRAVVFTDEDGEVLATGTAYYCSCGLPVRTERD